MPTTPQKNKSDSQNTRRDQGGQQASPSRSDEQTRKMGSQDQHQDRGKSMGNDRNRSGSDSER
jgi:hypothetical protein